MELMELFHYIKDNFPLTEKYELNDIIREKNGYYFSLSDKEYAELSNMLIDNMKNKGYTRYCIKKNRWMIYGRWYPLSSDPDDLREHKKIVKENWKVVNEYLKSVSSRTVQKIVAFIFYNFGATIVGAPETKDKGIDFYCYFPSFPNYYREEPIYGNIHHISDCLILGQVKVKNQSDYSIGDKDLRQLVGDIILFRENYKAYKFIPSNLKSNLTKFTPYVPIFVGIPLCSRNLTELANQIGITYIELEELIELMLDPRSKIISQKNCNITLKELTKRIEDIEILIENMT